MLIKEKNFMLVSDQTFIKNHLDKNEPLPPDHEKKMERTGNLEKVIAAVGGVMVTYAASASIKNGKNNWLHYGMAMVGGLLALRGIKPFLPNKETDSKNSTSDKIDFGGIQNKAKNYYQ